MFEFISWINQSTGLYWHNLTVPRFKKYIVTCSLCSRKGPCKFSTDWLQPIASLDWWSFLDTKNNPSRIVIMSQECWCSAWSWSSVDYLCKRQENYPGDDCPLSAVIQWLNKVLEDSSEPSPFLTNLNQIHSVQFTEKGFKIENHSCSMRIAICDSDSLMIDSYQVFFSSLKGSRLTSPWTAEALAQGLNHTISQMWGKDLTALCLGPSARGKFGWIGADWWTLHCCVFFQCMLLCMFSRYYVTHTPGHILLKWRTVVIFMLDNNN